MANIDSIRDFLGRTRRELLAALRVEAGIVMALCWLVLGSTGVLVAAHATSLGLVRWALVLGLLVATGVVLWRLVFGPWRELGDPAKLARQVESRVPDLHNGIVTTLEFADPDSDARRDDVSATLLDGVAATTAERLRRIEPRSLVERDRTRRLAKVLGGLTVAMVALVLIAPSAFERGWDRLLHGPSLEDPSGTRRVDAAVRDLRMRYVFPAYLSMDDRELAGGGDVVALPGTVVHIEAEPIEPAAAARIEFSDDATAPVELDVAGDGKLRGSFLVTEPTTYRFEIQNERGVSLRERTHRAIDVAVDETPDVEILIPSADIEVHLGDSVRVAYRARDDHGLDRIELVTSVRGQDEVTRRRIQTVDGDKVHQGETEVHLSEMRLEPGDRIDVTIEAFDLDTVSGPKAGRSESRTIKIWSPEEKHKELTDKLAAVAEAMLDVLADRLESPAEDKDLLRYRETVDSVSAANVKTGGIIEILDEILTEIELDPLMPETVQTEILTIRGRQSELTDAEGYAIRTAVIAAEQHNNPRKFQLLALLHGHYLDTTRALEEDIIKLEDLVRGLREEMFKEQARDLAAKQEELRKLLEALKNGEVDMSEALAKIDELQKQIDEMMAELAKQAKNMPMEHFNASALDPEGALQDMDSFQDQLDKMREMLAKGDIEGAMKLAEEMQRQLAEMAAMMEEELDGMSGMGGMGGAGQQEMMELDRRISELSEEESKIFDETNEIAQEVMEAVREALKEQMDEFLAEQLERVAQLMEELEEADSTFLDEEAEEKRRALEEAARDLAEILQRENLDQAQKIAEQVAEECDALRAGWKTGARPKGWVYSPRGKRWVSSTVFRSM